MLGIFFAYLFVASALACEHQDQYKKIGCFDSSHLETTLVFNNNDDAFNLENYKDKIPELVCDCFERTKDHYKYFSVGKNGDCFGGNFEDEPVQSAASSGNCVTANDNHHGGGQEESEYLYKTEAAAQSPINGGETEWGEWSECDVSCGGGQQSRERTCTNPIPNDSGSPCGDLTEVQDCNTHHCPIDGEYSEWTEYNECSVSCGGGFQTKTRTCTNPAPQYGGNDCVGDASETQSCNLQHCPINGGWSSYSSFGSCSKTCGGGTKTKTRSCNNPTPQYGGNSCVGPSTQSESCNTQVCLSSWSCSSYKYTSFSDDGNGKFWYLDRHEPSCGSNQAINYFRLERNSAHTKMRYKYKCCSTQLSCSNEWKYNSYTDDGEGWGALGDKTTTEYLDRQTVDCGDKKFISYFELQRNSGHDKVRYKYKCCALSSSYSTTCTTKYTSLSDRGSGKVYYLDRHGLSCGTNYNLKKFRLETHGSQQRYKYTCCKTNQP